MRIGLAAELTGRSGELGVEARNGAELAVQVINEQGGINGRQIELLVRDDRGDPEIAWQVDRDLIEHDVVAIIGHITSGQTMAVVEKMNEAGVVLISPTSSTSELSAQQDFFFRVMPNNEWIGQSLARYAYRTLHLGQVCGIYDLGNRAFAETLWLSVEAEYRKIGGQSDCSFPFTSGETDLQDLMVQVAAAQPEAVFFVASAIDTALLAQYGRQQGLNAIYLSSTWAQTNELFEKGGQAVEGIVMVATYDPQSPDPAYQAFVALYEERFGREPRLGASHTYEAVLVLAHALEQTGGRAEGLPDALVSIRDLPGVQGSITIDEYGDVKREIYVVRAENGVFRVVDTIFPDE